MGKLHYTIKGFRRDATAPVQQTLELAHDRVALEVGRGLLRKRKTVQQVEVWRAERRIGPVERVV